MEKSLENPVVINHDNTTEGVVTAIKEALTRIPWPKTKEEERADALDSLRSIMRKSKDGPHTQGQREGGE